MLGQLFSIFCIFSCAFAFFFAKDVDLGTAILQNADRAVTLTVSLIGSMGLWCGILKVFSVSGWTKGLSRLLSPILKRVFPDAWEKENGKEEIAASVAANLLGIGNAATPLALCAMQKLAQNQADDEKKEIASDDMVTFTVLNTAPLSLLPTTLLALRSAANSQNPTEILPLVWICSFASWCVAILLSKGLRYLWRQ